MLVIRRIAVSVTALFLGVSAMFLSVTAANADNGWNRADECVNDNGWNCPTP